MRRRIYRPIYIDIWDHPKIKPLSGPATLIVFYLLTSPHTNTIGLYRCNKATIGGDLYNKISKGFGEPFVELYSEAFRIAFEEAFREVLDTNLFFYDPQAELILIRDWFEYNAPTNSNHVKGLYKFFELLPQHSPLIAEWLRWAEHHFVNIDKTKEKPFLQSAFRKTFSQPLAKPFPKGLSEGLPEGLRDNREQRTENREEKEEEVRGYRILDKDPAPPPPPPTSSPPSPMAPAKRLSPNTTRLARQVIDVYNRLIVNSQNPRTTKFSPPGDLATPLVEKNVIAFGAVVNQFTRAGMAAKSAFWWEELLTSAILVDRYMGFGDKPYPLPIGRLLSDASFAQEVLDAGRKAKAAKAAHQAPTPPADIQPIPDKERLSPAQLAELTAKAFTPNQEQATS